MKTELTTDVDQAAEYIRRGGIVAFPTETVYGLGANVFDENAVAKIFEAKQRPTDNPLIAHISSLELINELAQEVTKNASKFIDAFFPGPLTIVLKKRCEVPMIATAGLDTIGIRMPRFELANQFLTACNVPVVAPSANLSGRPSPTTWQAVYEDLDGRIDCILQGEITEIGIESTVVDCTGEVPVLLRTGSVSLDELRAIVPETTHQHGTELSLRSPGLRHKHYSPRARVILVDDAPIESEKAAFIGTDTTEAEFALTKSCVDVEDYAHSLFEFFRECDRRGISTIFCQTVSTDGIGAALMDRLRRAANG
ncbi:MAG TPA: L-threonylcarbamoyladenylate synthase [Pyrinomonadaceae bacterium]|nr:L-threonylcarbamoyladenylate synthase [Pyrinomonadaceae bacterium]